MYPAEVGINIRLQNLFYGTSPRDSDLERNPTGICSRDLKQKRGDSVGLGLLSNPRKDAKPLFGVYLDKDGVIQFREPKEKKSNKLEKIVSEQ